MDCLLAQWLLFVPDISVVNIHSRTQLTVVVLKKVNDTKDNLTPYGVVADLSQVLLRYVLRGQVGCSVVIVLRRFGTNSFCHGVDW